MNNKLILSFGLGAAAGAVVTYFIMRKKNKDFMWADDFEEPTPEAEGEKTSDTSEVKCFDSNWKSSRKRTNYNDIYRKKYGPTDPSPTDEDYPMYIITPEEYAAKDSYEAITLYYYRNHILTDADDNVIENIDAIVGEDALNHIGDYEEDVIHVRNDDRETDYEIQYVGEEFEPMDCEDD